VRIIRSKKYTFTLKDLMRYISLDSKSRAVSFKSEIDKRINNLVNMPYKCRKSVYFEDKSIRDLIYKGYTIVYKVDEEKETITIIGMKKYKNEL